MNDLQGLFDKLQEEKREQKEIRREYKDALSHDILYQQTEEELKTLREKKKLIESEIRSQMGSRWERFEDLKFDITEIQQMISDVAMSSLMKGESIAIKDAYDIVYEPKFSVTFKKADGVKDGE
jgi:serine phosphatase RsbU (regulator of sigma subunit)